MDALQALGRFLREAVDAGLEVVPIPDSRLGLWPIMVLEGAFGVLFEGILDGLTERLDVGVALTRVRAQGTEDHVIEGYRRPCQYAGWFKVSAGDTTGQQLIEDHCQGVEVGPLVDGMESVFLLG